MKRILTIVLLGSILSTLTSRARAGDADDVSKLARGFMVTLACLDYDKIAAFGRPQDVNAFPKPPDEVLNQFRDLQNLADVQDLRRQIADQANKAIALDPPAFTPDNTCAIVTAAPVMAEARKFFELMLLYVTYVTTVQENKAQKLPMPKLEDIRASILAPGSPEQRQIDMEIATLPKLKVRLQFEKGAAGWRVNLHAFETALDAGPPGPP
jgi:hypothetical protein